MKTVRYTAAAATILMSLMNLPFAFGHSGGAVSTAIAWLVTLLGVVGLVVAVGLIRRTVWGGPATLAVGVANLIGAVVAMVQGREGALVGLVVSLVAAGLATAVVRRSAAQETRTA